MLQAVLHPSYWHADIGETWIRFVITRLIPSPGAEIKALAVAFLPRRTSCGILHAVLLEWAKLIGPHYGSDCLPLVQLIPHQFGAGRNCTRKKVVFRLRL